MSRHHKIELEIMHAEDDSTSQDIWLSDDDLKKFVKFLKSKANDKIINYPVDGQWVMVDIYTGQHKGGVPAKNAEKTMPTLFPEVKL